MVGVIHSGAAERNVMYHVSLPWTYYLVHASYSNPNKKKQRNQFQFVMLQVLFRNTPIINLADDSLYAIDFPNGPSGSMCLGNSLQTGTHFDSPESLASASIGAFYSSAFENTSIQIPLADYGDIDNFSEWKALSKRIAPDHLQLDTNRMPRQSLFGLMEVEWYDFALSEEESSVTKMASVVHFSHKCHCCTFLGHHQEHDLYYCTQNGTIPTIIARFGNEPDDYYSGLAFGFMDGDHPLVEARKRAEAKNLDCHADRYTT